MRITRSQLRRLIREEAESFLPADDPEAAAWAGATASQAEANAKYVSGKEWWKTNGPPSFIQVTKYNDGRTRKKKHPGAGRLYWNTGHILTSKDAEGLRLLGMYRAQWPNVKNTSREGSWIGDLLSDDGKIAKRIEQLQSDHKKARSGTEQSVFRAGDELPADMIRSFEDEPEDE